MLDWDDLRYFLAVQRSGTLTKAGEKLGINPTTVGRRLSALEENLGSRLFERTSDGHIATEAGERLLPKAERMEAEVLALEREVAGDDQRLEGTVRLTATEMLATRFIAPRLRRFNEKFPDLQLDLICTSREVDLGRRDADIALRLYRPMQDNLMARRLADIHVGLYAAKDYLQSHGMPTDPSNSLAGHNVLLFADSRAFARENDWFHPKLAGARIVARSDSVSSIYSATVGGSGIALLPRQVADLDERLEAIPTSPAPDKRAIWQMVHRDMLGNARIRVVLDFLAKILSVPGETQTKSEMPVDPEGRR